MAEISLEELLQSAVMDIYHPAQQANIDVRLQLNAHDVIRTGQPLLLSLLVRNRCWIMRFATVRKAASSTLPYMPAASPSEIMAPGVAPEILTHIGERFYRPPGQSVTGSGLGLSIVRRIATLHGMTVSFGNAAEGWI
ncbi:two-component system sensor histidine kinase [Salmonella enterica subsp. enterica]|uniref:histidine kinase n=1 Tax=Salmonella enterica I TaxID=59201 RepID=A0A447N3Q4_SALET|nr:two-component system sensor histidine kinase [Salmonella enterica subsp. enterica]